MTDELTAEQLQNIKRTQEARDQAKRAKFISDALVQTANNERDVEHTLYYARAGQYGKDDEVFVRDEFGHTKWYDPAEDTIIKHHLVCSYTREELLTLLFSSIPKSYVIFKRSFSPRWNVEEQESLVIYQK